MKKSLVIIIALFTFLISKSQDTTIIYYDASWKKTTIEKSLFYRIIYKVEKKKWNSSDYNKDGSLRFSGEYSKRNLKVKNGIFTYYHVNGIKKEFSNFDNNVQVGSFQEWFDNGQIKINGQFKDNERTGEWISYSKDGKLNSKGSYSRDKKIGEWNWYYENEQICASEWFNDGKVTSGNYWTEEGEALDSTIANVKPEFAGGLDALERFLIETTKYPIEAQNRGAYGKVYVQFVINTDGSVSDVKIARGVDSALDKEALRVVRLMPYWTPGKMHNKLVRVSYIVPIIFKIFR